MRQRRARELDEQPQHVARTLDYLHSDCAPSVAHCDIKPENVLCVSAPSGETSAAGGAHPWHIKLCDLGPEGRDVQEQVGSLGEAFGPAGLPPSEPIFHPPGPAVSQLLCDSFNAHLARAVHEQERRRRRPVGW